MQCQHSLKNWPISHYILRAAPGRHPPLSSNFFRYHTWKHKHTHNHMYRDTWKHKHAHMYKTQTRSYGQKHLETQTHSHAQKYMKHKHTHIYREKHMETQTHSHSHVQKHKCPVNTFRCSLHLFCNNVSIEILCLKCLVFRKIFQFFVVT